VQNRISDIDQEDLRSRHMIQPHLSIVAKGPVLLARCVVSLACQPNSDSKV